MLRWLTGRKAADLAVFHEFAPPPTGGGHQFMRALWRELERRGLVLESNRIPRGARACLFNSFNFDFRRLCRQAQRRQACRMVHRVDGPLQTYRGFDDGTDGRIHEINRRLAHATVFQSRFSLQAHIGLGYAFAAPVVIPNAVDPLVFHARGRAPFGGSRKIRLISVSWSDNPNKGAAVYRWLDKNLDGTRYEYTFVGRIRERFDRIRTVAPVASAELAEMLRGHDVYITASRNDPCSNSLLEALACGLPCLYLNSGGHPEIAGEAGLPFDEAEEIPALLDRLAENYNAYRSAIRTATIEDSADRYLNVLMPRSSA